ncbi:MAG TPA: siderophore-interacting protein [Intrasporangiaceae bacterium]|nr:siderophore-interacting protein [Intrasporangiaceae bacterium]
MSTTSQTTQHKDRRTLPPLHVGRVRRREWISADMVRIVLGGEGLARFDNPEGWTDTYVNLLFPPADAPYQAPFELDEVRELDRALWPTPRRYTVRRWDRDTREMWIDFVIHGDEGTAGRWARDVQPGELLQFRGPGGAYRPAPHASHHLLVGDESALPAIAAAVEEVEAGARVTVVGLVDAPDGQIPLESPGRLELHWLHRRDLATDPADPAIAAALVTAVADLDLSSGCPDVQAFVHGEAEETRAVRRYLLGDRMLPRERISVSPYWRRNYTDEAWRQIKQDWVRQVEQDS